MHSSVGHSFQDTVLVINSVLLPFCQDYINAFWPQNHPTFSQPALPKNALKPCTYVQLLCHSPHWPIEDGADPQLLYVSNKKQLQVGGVQWILYSRHAVQEFLCVCLCYVHFKLVRIYPAHKCILYHSTEQKCLSILKTVHHFLTVHL